MISRLPDETLHAVIHFCVSFLYEKFPNERGIFRSTVSQTQVRELQSQIANHNLKPRDDVDPHVVAEVIQTSLKGLASPLLHEVYPDILSSELIEDDFENNRGIVQQWMKKIPEQKYSLFNAIFKLLAKLAELEENDSGVVQLAYTISPTICRPLNHAYMSIRHMEDLKKIRPVILFLIENYTDVFFPYKPNVFQSPYATATTSTQPSSDHSVLPELMPSAMVLDVKVDDVKQADQGQGFPFIKPNLLVMIPSLHAPGTEGSSSDADSESEKSQGAQAHSYSDTEWKIFQALVNTRVSSFMDLGERDASQFLTQEASGDTYHTIMQAWTARVATAATTASPSKADLSSVPVSPSSSSIGSLHRLNLQKSSARRSHRRKMVAECKGLRAQITNFEQEFAKVHNRQPKSQERGNMQATYIKYRELKREIRDSAATDLQRVMRGYLARKMLGFRIGRKLSPPNRYSSTSSGAMAKVATSQQSGGTAISDQAAEFIAKYRECSESKRDLKRKLKKFDEDFVVQHNRAPKKSDKEVIRPMYQKYHEIKNQLDSLKKLIQQSNIPIPDDLKEDFFQPSTTGATAIGGESKRSADSDFETDDSKSSNRGRKGMTSDDDTGLFDDGAVKPTGATASNFDKSQYNLEALQLEKKNLHAYLKVYERDFNRTHGRPVTKSEDILPVANEYQRYKELKNLIKDLKG